MRILFVLQSIGIGGSMTSLINLMTLLKKNNEVKFEVLFMDPYGELFEDAKKVANVCKRDMMLEASTINRKKIIDMKLYDTLFLRLILVLEGKLKKVASNEIGFQKAAKKYDNKYDCVIAYQESIATNFAIKIKAKKHIAWVHNDYENIKKIYKNEAKLTAVYDLYNKIICVSKSGSEKFKKLSKIKESKISYIYNTLLVNELKKKSLVNLKDILIEEQNDILYNALNFNGLKLVSSGRFVEQKRFDRVVEVASILRDQGYKFKWFIIGTGELFDNILSKIKNKNLEEYIYLTGKLTNPFPVVKICDFFVLTSDFEAHPMVANEALIVGTPVITTNFESAHEVIANELNGIICDMNSNSIAKAILKMINNKNLHKRIQENVNNFNYLNNQIIAQVMDIILS